MSTNMGNLEKLGILVIVILVVVVGVMAITPKSTVDERLLPEGPAPLETAQGPETLEPAVPGADGTTGPADPWPKADVLGAQKKLPGEGVNADLNAAPQASPAAVPAEPTFRTVKIQSGDTLAKLAQRELGSAARYQEILKANPGLVATKLQKGQEIKIPVAAAKPATDERSAANAQTQVTPQTTPVVSSDRVYTVKKGDTLSSIAAREMGSKAKWQELLKANEDVLHGSTALKIDMKLQIPGGEKASSTSSDLAPRAATESTAPAPGERDYVVKPGDSLWLIAKNEMGSEKLVGALREANEGVLKGSDSLKVGTTLRIPARQ